MQLTKEDFEMAKKAIDWAKNIDPHNDYLYNINVIAQTKVIDVKSIGFAASIVSSYQREMNTLKKKEKEATSSEFFGKIKKRDVFDLVVDKIIAYAGYIGLSYLHIMHDTDGNKAIWFASSKSKFEEGSKIKVKATVKNHQVRDGIKQTILTRVVALT